MQLRREKNPAGAAYLIKKAPWVAHRNDSLFFITYYFYMQRSNAYVYPCHCAKRIGAGLYLRPCGHGTVFELPCAEYCRYDHRWRVHPWLCRVGYRRSGGASVPWFCAGHAGRCLRRVCHRVPANPPGRAVHFGGYYYQYRALHRKPCHHGLFFQRSHAEN